MSKQTKRRTWDVNDYKNMEKGKKNNTKLKYTRKEDRVTAVLDLNLEKAVGKRFIDSTQQAGYMCKICSLLYSDSQSYLDHINSRMHQISAGISDIPEKVSLKQVIDRIEYWKNQKPESETVEQVKKRVLSHQLEMRKKKKIA
eukprot:NODE_38_length_30618_cov_0.377142.p20 type:complete len:143 gc:universal NODE_38_length_30618_cov_0.377142:4556-4984(+)